MNRKIKKIGIIGAGVMGSQLAEFFASAGMDVELFDIVQPKGVDDSRIRTGLLDRDFDRLLNCDWIIEAIVEDLDAKRALYERLDGNVKSGTTITSNTSGILWRYLAEGRSDEFRRNFFVTHFFNPPRYMKLVEIVAGDEVEKESITRVTEFLESKLGKGIVRAKDTPGFIANRIGVFHAMDVMHLTEENGWPIDLVDTVLGEAIGRPKSAIFGTADIVGIDTLVSVASLLERNLPHDNMSQRLETPAFVKRMIEKGLTGRKAESGFYRNDPQSGELLVYDIERAGYRPAERYKITSRGCQALTSRDDFIGEIARISLSNLIEYSTRLVPEIAGDPSSIDLAMKWGYNWQQGPFEMKALQTSFATKND